MSVESNVSGHWTDEQLIAHLYGIGPEDRHRTLREQPRSQDAGDDSFPRRRGLTGR